MSRFFSEFVHSLEPYVPGEQPKMARLVKLNTNENPYGPSDKVLGAINACADERLRLYPDPDSTALRAAAAEFHGVAPDQVFVGNGSDEVLAHLFHGFFTGKGAIAFPDISYSFYKVYCGLYGIDYDCQPLTDDFAIDLCAYPANCGGIIFPNPNAPTGRVLPLADIRALLERCADTLVVVDEAYIDFGGESAVALVKDYDNLLVTQTLSKSRSLAGLRVGLAIGQRPLIDGLERIKNSFNSYPIDRVAEAAAVASFQDREWFQTTCQRIIDSREALVTSLTALGFAVLPSAANFVFARHNARAGAELAAALRGEGVIVRHFARPERIADYLRITVGSEAENRALLDALGALL